MQGVDRQEELAKAPNEAPSHTGLCSLLALAVG